MRMAIQGRVTTAALAIVVAALLTTHVARSEESKCRCQERTEVRETSVPILGKLPYVGRLFRTVGIKVEAAPECDCQFERIGIDFDAVPGKVIELHGPLTACPASGEVCLIAAARCDEEKCQEAVCPAVACTKSGCCTSSKCCADAKCCAAECCQKEACLATSQEKSELWQHVAELNSENAAMEAMLEAHQEILEAREEMFETVTELMVEKAKLEAKLEMVEHRDGLLKELVELQAENARLKAHAEVAQQKEELLQAHLMAALENERLKQRVAELERQVGTESEPVLAEKKSKAKKNR